MAERTVKVTLKGDASDLLRTYAQADSATERLGREVDKTDRKIRDTFKSGPKLPVELDPLMTDFQAHLRKELAALARTVNAEIPVSPQTDRLRQQIKNRLVEIERNLKIEVPTEPGSRREYELALRNMVDDATRHVKAHVKVDRDGMAADFTKAGTKAGTGFASSFTQSTSGLGGMVMPILIGAAIGAAPAAASLVSGLVLAGLGTGVLAGGIALAFRDESVKSAAQDLGKGLIDDMSAAASGFVTPLRDGMAYLKSTFASEMPEIRKQFALVEPMIGKLTTGVAGLVHELLPGITAGLEGAQPMIDVIAEWLPELGSALGDFFEILGQDGERTSQVLAVALAYISAGIRTTAWTIRILTSTWNSAVGGFLLGLDFIAGSWTAAFGWIPGVGEKLKEFSASTRYALDQFHAGAGAAADATKGYAGEVTASAGPLDAAKARTEALNTRLEDQIRAGKTLTDIWRTLNGGLADADQAMLRASEQLKVIKDGWNEHGKAITGNTDAALKNRIALTEYLQIANQIYDANIAAGKGTDVAAAAANAYVDRLRDTMKQAGYTKAEIDLFIATVSNVPPSKTTMLSVDNQASGVIQQVQGEINRMQGRTLVIETITQAPRGYGRYDDDGSGYGTNRWGGVYTPAADGLLREAATFTSANPGRYMIAEPQTGGEAFVPRFGNAGRSTAILQQAAGWYGMTVGRAGGGGEQFVGTVILQLDGESVHNSQLRFQRLSRT